MGLSAAHVYERQEALADARFRANDEYDRIWYDSPPNARDVERIAHHPDVVAARARVESIATEVAGLQEEIGGKVYRTVNSKLDALRERIAKLNRRAAKLGVEEIALKVTDETESEERIARHVSQEAIDVLGGNNVSKEIVDFTYVVLAGEAPRVPGFRFIAVLDHTVQEGATDAVGIARVPSTDEAIDLSGYRHAPNRCDHCGYERQRNQTYVVWSEGETKTLQVGSTCLRDFTGANNPHAAASWAEYLAALDADLTVEGEDLFGAVGGRRAVNTLEYLTHVAACTREDGWRKRWNEYGDRGYGTADQAHQNLADYGKTEKGRPLYVEVTEDDKALAEKALTWVRDDLGEREDLSEFEHNLVTYTLRDYLPEKGDGIVAYAVEAYRRSEDKRLRTEHAAKVAATSEYVAAKGDRVKGLVWTVTFTREFEGDYGTRYLAKGLTPDGNQIIWWGSRPLEQGKTYSMTATVKRHTTDDYNGGAKATEITRPAKITEVEEPEVETAEEVEVTQTAEEREAARVKRLDPDKLERKLLSASQSLWNARDAQGDSNSRDYDSYYADQAKALERRVEALESDLRATGAEDAEDRIFAAHEKARVRSAKWVAITFDVDCDGTAFAAHAVHDPKVTEVGITTVCDVSRRSDFEAKYLTGLSDHDREYWHDVGYISFGTAGKMDETARAARGT